MLPDSPRGQGSGLNVMDATAAQAEIASLKADQEFMGKFFAGDKLAIARWNELHLRAFPEQKAA
jgi:hypothetical protein